LISTLGMDETFVILSATMVIKGKTLETANLFFQTFKRNNISDWKLVRSYIEEGIPNGNINRIQLEGKVEILRA